MSYATDIIKTMTFFNPDILDRYIKAYAESGARSPDKLKPVHGYIAQELDSNILSRIKYSMHKTFAKGHSIAAQDKELKVDGLFYPKNSDITLVDDKGKKIGVIAAKFPISNFGQNANNYFEGMLGETANLKLAGVSVGHVIVLPYVLPYYSNASSENDKLISKIEKISNNHIDKYRKLYNTNSIASPDALHISLVAYGVEDHYLVGLSQSKVTEKILSSQLNVSPLSKVLTRAELAEKGFSEENLDFLQEVSNFDNFINKIARKCLP
jgi:hypothetical protein